DWSVTGVQTCALPIFPRRSCLTSFSESALRRCQLAPPARGVRASWPSLPNPPPFPSLRTHAFPWQPPSDKLCWCAEPLELRIPKAASAALMRCTSFCARSRCFFNSCTTADRIPICGASRSEEDHSRTVWPGQQTDGSDSCSFFLTSLDDPTQSNGH